MIPRPPTTDELRASLRRQDDRVIAQVRALAETRVEPYAEHVEEDA